MHSDNTFALAMSSTVQPWRGKNSIFTQGFVPATSPWVGTSSAQSSAEGMGTADTTLLLTESAIFVDKFVPAQQCLPLSFASGVHPSQLDGAINLGDVFPFNTRLLSSVFLLLHVHAPLYFRCTGICICTCALRQTPHGHMRIRCVGLCVRVHILCMCTSPQEHLSCIVYSVFRRPPPCNPSTAHMCISHRRLRNTTPLSAYTGHQIRASQCTHSPL